MYVEDDRSVILLWGEKSPTIQISSSSNNPAEIHFLDANGSFRFTMGAFGNNDAGMIVRDSKGHPRIMMGYEEASDKGTIQCDGKVFPK